MNLFYLQLFSLLVFLSLGEFSPKFIFLTQAQASQKSCADLTKSVTYETTKRNLFKAQPRSNSTPQADIWIRSVSEEDAVSSLKTLSKPVSVRGKPFVFFTAEGKISDPPQDVPTREIHMKGNKANLAFLSESFSKGEFDAILRQAQAYKLVLHLLTTENQRSHVVVFFPIIAGRYKANKKPQVGVSSRSFRGNLSYGRLAQHRFFSILQIALDAGRMAEKKVWSDYGLQLSTVLGSEIPSAAMMLAEGLSYSFSPWHPQSFYWVKKSSGTAQEASWWRQALAALKILEQRQIIYVHKNVQAFDSLWDFPKAGFLTREQFHEMWGSQAKAYFPETPRPKQRDGWILLFFQEALEYVHALNYRYDSTREVYEPDPT